MAKYDINDQGNYPLIVDLSHHNTVNLQDLQLAGVVGVIHKATEGTSFVDKKRAERGAEAYRLGLPFATYHFLRPGNPEEQMQHYLKTVKPVPGELLCIDYEPTNQGDPSMDDLLRAIEYLKSKENDYKIVVYSGHLIKEKMTKTFAAALAGLNTDLWLAHYTSNKLPTMPTGGVWPHWILWQWTDQANIDGVAPGTTIDMNRFNGTTKEAIAWMNGNKDKPTDIVIPSDPLPIDPIPNPVPTDPIPILPTMNINIDMPEGVNVNLTINGKSYTTGT